MGQIQDKEEIIQLVKDYYNKYHINKAYQSGDRIQYAGRIYDEKEMTALVDSALEFWLTSGRYTQKFEEEFAKTIGVRYCSLVNSGSSANLLAFMALTSPLLKDRRIYPGDEVVTVAAGFPTTISPIVQYGAVPVFVDVTIPEMNIDVSMLEDAYSPKTKAVFLAHTLGNPFDIQAVKGFCDKYGLWLIEDNCDALGSEYTLDGKTGLTGSFGDIATSSFYPPHHITMGEGGAVYTNNPLLHRIIRSFRDWGRDCSCASGQDNLCGHRFEGQYGQLPEGYDHKYVYSHFGYNLKATDMQAAIGCAQLEKIESFVEARKYNFDYLHKGFSQLEDYFLLPKETKHSNPSWFGFIVTCKEGVNRKDVITHLENHDIQTRLLFAGNMVRQPCFSNDETMTSKYRVIGKLSNTDKIMNNSFWLGVYPGMNEAKMDEMIKRVKEVVL